MVDVKSKFEVFSTDITPFALLGLQFGNYIGGHNTKLI